MRGFTDDDSNDGVTVNNVRCLRATEKAILCSIDGDEHWIPQSQITDLSEVYKVGDEGKLVITGWFAKQSGLGED